MGKTIKFSVLFVIFCGCVPPVFAAELSGNAFSFSWIGVSEFFAVGLILFFCLKGIKSCLKGEGYSNFRADYFTEKMEDNLYRHEMSEFDIDSAKRVRKLMEAKRKSGITKGSTINQINKSSSNSKIVTNIK